MKENLAASAVEPTNLYRQPVSFDAKKKKGDPRSCIEEAVWQSFLLDACKSDNYSPKGDCRRLIEDSMLIECRAGLYGERMHLGWRRFILAKLNGCVQKCKGWLLHHDKIYDFLIFLGVKNLYMRLKWRLE